MTKLLLFISTIFLCISCSSSLTTIKDPSLQPNHYHKALLVTETYHSNKSGFKKLFDTETRNLETVSGINEKLIKILIEQLSVDQKNVQIYLAHKNNNQELVLNDTPENKTQKEIEKIVLDDKIDLVITIYPKDIRREYNGGINTGVGIGNPNFGLSATTNSSNLKFTYVFTAIDTKTQLEVWKGKYEVQNANHMFNNPARKVSKKLLIKLKEDQLF